MAHLPFDRAPQGLKPQLPRLIFGTTKQAAVKPKTSDEISEMRSSGTKAHADFDGFMRGLNRLRKNS
jgi:hypothetical protein